MQREHLPCWATKPDRTAIKINICCTTRGKQWTRTRMIVHVAFLCLLLYDSRVPGRLSENPSKQAGCQFLDLGTMPDIRLRPTGLLAWPLAWLREQRSVAASAAEAKASKARRASQTTGHANHLGRPEASGASGLAQRSRGLACTNLLATRPLDPIFPYCAVARSTLLARSDARRHGPDWVLSASGHSGMAKATCKALQSHGTWSELDCERPQDIRGGINFALEGFGSDCHLLRLLPSFVFASEICPDPMIPHACWCLQALVRAARGARGHRTGPGAGPVCCMTI